MAKKFRTKIVEIEATQFDGQNYTELETWTEGSFRPVLDNFQYVELASGIITGEVFDKLHNTWIGVVPGQWIVRGVKGEYYPCDNETFFWKYEEIDGETEAKREELVKKIKKEITKAHEDMNRMKSGRRGE